MPLVTCLGQPIGSYIIYCQVGQIAWYNRITTGLFNYLVIGYLPSITIETSWSAINTEFVLRQVYPDLSASEKEPERGKKKKEQEGSPSSLVRS
jgi:hypothetical protein